MGNSALVLHQIVEAARRGDRVTQEALVELLPRSQKAALEVGGGLARETEKALLRALTGDDGAPMRYVADEEIPVLRAELGGVNPNALERLLVDRIICCWLEANGAEWDCASERNRLALDMKRGEFFEKRLGRAHRRLLSAVKTLAQVRRLMGVNVQVNFADQQINLCG